jgi:hypothetical protein
MGSLQSTNYPLELSFDGGSTWHTLVCLTQFNIPLSKAANVTETFCGPEVGLGSGTFNPTGTAVCETEPTSTQVTYKRLLTAWDAEELIQFRLQALGTGSIGNHFYLRGSCYVTDLDLTLQTAQTIQFNWTLTGTGTLDTTP